eukprot:g31919.t1
MLDLQDLMIHSTKDMNQLHRVTSENWELKMCCAVWASLKLSGSKSEFLPTGSDLIDLMEIYVNVKRAVLLPGLTTLEVSGCPLNGRIRDLVLPLAFCEHLGSIIAVDCGLHGEFGCFSKGNVCNCPNGSAIFDGHCLECFPPLRRCKGGTISAEHCGEGYHGPLCMRCEERYYAVRSSCVKCTGVGWPQWLLMALTFVCIGALLAGGFVAVAYFVYAWSPLSWLDGWIKSAARVIFAPEPLGEWQQQLVKRQAPVLLQTCQLWSVLSSLAARDDKASDMLWELPYVQHVQLAVGNLQEILYLQCFFDGKQVRKMVAFITPAVPLLLLLGCGPLEFGLAGVNAALKILTLFFVGGASKCAALITCQRVDAGGWALQSNMTVLRHLPDIDCYQDSMVPPDVAGVFWPCAVGYAILMLGWL